MNRLTLLSAALVATLSAPAMAASYSASLAAPAQWKIIARDIVWNCGPAACQGTSDYGSTISLCQSLVKKAGRIERFAVDGRALGAEQLDRCNSAAKPAADTAVANR